ncbi:MAG: hypothetical protein O3B83_02360 [Bacteroidetes bacterium]|nr:hypothetical protein [Bacteroidota bacterium]
MAVKLRLHSSPFVKVLLTLLVLSLYSPGLAAQKGNRPPKDPQKEAAKKEEAKVKALDRDIKKLKKEFRKKQDKPTRKRMKTNKVRSKRQSENKKEPWLKSFFKRRDNKKVKKGKGV